VPRRTNSRIEVAEKVSGELHELESVASAAEELSASINNVGQQPRMMLASRAAPSIRPSRPTTR